eukprot:s749_g3.t2
MACGPVVVAVGSPNWDTMAFVPDTFLSEHGLGRGDATPLDDGAAFRALKESAKSLSARTLSHVVVAPATLPRCSLAWAARPSFAAVWAAMRWPANSGRLCANLAWWTFALRPPTETVGRFFAWLPTTGSDLSPIAQVSRRTPWKQQLYVLPSTALPDEAAKWTWSTSMPIRFCAQDPQPRRACAKHAALGQRLESTLAPAESSVHSRSASGDFSKMGNLTSLCSIKTRQQLSSARTCPRATFAGLCRSTVNSPSSPWAPTAFGSPRSEDRQSFSEWSHWQRWWIVLGLETSLPAAFSHWNCTPWGYASATAVLQVFGTDLGLEGWHRLCTSCAETTAKSCPPVSTHRFGINQLRIFMTDGTLRASKTVGQLPEAVAAAVSAEIERVEIFGLKVRLTAAEATVDGKVSALPKPISRALSGDGSASLHAAMLKVKPRIDMRQAWCTKEYYMVLRNDAALNASRDGYLPPEMLQPSRLLLLLQVVMVIRTSVYVQHGASP